MPDILGEIVPDVGANTLPYNSVTLICQPDIRGHEAPHHHHHIQPCEPVWPSGKALGR